jgi:hypothetical protein
MLKITLRTNVCGASTHRLCRNGKHTENWAWTEILAAPMRDGSPTLFRPPEVNFTDDKTGKPIGIKEAIGRHPVAAFGNSDSDLQTLQWTTISGVRLGVIVRHTDAECEYAYDRQSRFGRLDVVLDAAAVNKWMVVDMKKDWKVILPFEKR